MTTFLHPGWRRACTTLSMVLSCGCLWGCLGTTAPATRQEVKVAPFAPAPAAAVPGMTRAVVQQDVMRFAARYVARMTLVADRLLQQAQTVDARALALGWKMASRETAVRIAVGPDAVTNLLDMLVLASLTRLQVKSYWVPEVIGAQQGKELLQAARILEKDIWSIANAVLTPKQQQELRALIQQWHNTYPEQHYFWGVTFGEFSGQHAADLERAVARGGLLGQVQQTRETIDEVRDLGERLLFYMQNAVPLTRLQLQFGAYEMLRTPEMERLLGDAERFSASLERVAGVAETLLETRLEAIDQFMQQLTEQRRGLLQDLLSEENRVRPVLADLRQTVVLGQELAATVNSTVQTVAQLADTLAVVASRMKLPEFDINDYRRSLVDVKDTAGELTQFVHSLDALMSTQAWGEQRPQALRMVYEIDAQIESLILRIFALLFGLIIVFFLALFAYRYAVARTHIGLGHSAD